MHFISNRIPLIFSKINLIILKKIQKDFRLKDYRERLIKIIRNAPNYHRGANWRFHLPLEWLSEELLRACSCGRKSRMKGAAAQSAECLERAGSHTYFDYLALTARRQVWLWRYLRARECECISTHTCIRSLPSLTSRSRLLSPLLPEFSRFHSFDELSSSLFFHCSSYERKEEIIESD